MTKTFPTVESAAVFYAEQARLLAKDPDQAEVYKVALETAEMLLRLHALEAVQPKEAGVSEPTPLEKRPSIERITYISAEGNPHPYEVGRGCSEVREVEENGEYCMILWIEVWDGDNLLARFNQHKLEHIIYKRGNQ